ncbi:thioredoxin-like domain-containing protein [Adhaeribacter aquaticus]|uniref:thioredoxin-like domain-containing protein n=1 Tax=Adhaeribacter aquaticus TaxID=299567 RepID=UPI0003F997C3|nr:thioredoxin-like domain-containing protein [Adhaeribacter aquaticus]
MITGRVRAPKLNTRHGWLNSDKEYTLQDFKGKIILLDFWTLGCINCQHIIPDLKRLEEEFAEELVVIGVHSGKFDAEKSHNAIRKAILKFGIPHPVINDADWELWRQYAINAWPTIVLIDPDGNVIGQKAGEGVYDVVKPNIENLIAEYGDKINRTVFHFKPEESLDSVLQFPAKLTPDAEGNIYVTDSGHNRILKINEDGKILEIIGSGKTGFENGSFEDASFNEPQGMALRDNILYVADAKNNAIRIVDLVEKVVSTAAGTGELEYYFYEEKWDEPVNPNSPWDLVIAGDELFIANAGNHQILKMDLRTEKVMRFAGNGREALADGPLREASFNQPSGLSLRNHLLFVADAEASAIRVIDLHTDMVTTLIGQGLFVFGDQDGVMEAALLQHAVGITVQDDKLYIADTYNGKIKVLDLKLARVKTLVSGLDEPNDVTFVNGMLWVTDTHHHQILKINLETGEKHIVVVAER